MRGSGAGGFGFHKTSSAGEQTRRAEEGYKSVITQEQHISYYQHDKQISAEANFGKMKVVDDFKEHWRGEDRADRAPLPKIRPAPSPPQLTEYHESASYEKKPVATAATCGYVLTTQRTTSDEQYDEVRFSKAKN